MVIIPEKKEEKKKRKKSSADFHYFPYKPKILKLKVEVSCPYMQLLLKSDIIWNKPVD